MEAEKGAWLVELETMPDHVHLMVEVGPQFGYTGRSTSRSLVASAPRELAWLCSRLPTVMTKPYFVATVGRAPRSVINRYVNDQKSR